MRTIIVTLSIIISILIVSSCSDFRYVTEKRNTKIIIDTNYSNSIEKYNYKKADSVGFLRETYNKNGGLLSQELMDDTTKWNFIGEAKYYYDTGEIRIIKHYDKKGYLDGELLGYYKNGQLKRKELYKKGQLVESQCFDSLGNKRLYTPFYIDLDYNLADIASNLEYPESLRKKGIEEKLLISVCINKKGNPVIAYYDSLSSKEFVMSAIEALKNCHCIQPAYENDEPIAAWLCVPFTFKLK